MMGYLVFGLLFVLIVVFAILSWKHWHWANSVFLILCYIMAVVVGVQFAAVTERNSNDLKNLQRTADTLTKNQKDSLETIYGPPNTSYSATSLKGINMAYQLETTAQGRIWRNGNVEATGPNENKVFLFPKSDNPAQGEGILKDLILFAFQEIDANGKMAPVNFIGTVKVDSSEPNKLMNLSPVFVVDENAFQQGGSWTLYERMPGDRHETFIRANNLPPDIAIEDFRNLLTTEIFPAGSVGMDPASPEYEQFIDQFAFDGRTMGEIQNWIDAHQDNRVKKTFLPTPDEEFIRYTFSKSSIDYQVDAKGNMETEGPFTLNGQAIDPQLHLGRTVKFKAGATISVDRATADGYSRPDDRVVERFDQIEAVTPAGSEFHRRLYDFPAQISNYRRESNAYALERADTVEIKGKIQESLNNAEKQILKREDLVAKLQEDKKNLESDLQTITVLAEEKTNKLGEMNDRIDALEQQITAMRARLGGGAN